MTRAKQTPLSAACRTSTLCVLLLVVGGCGRDIPGNRSESVGFSSVEALGNLVDIRIGRRNPTAADCKAVDETLGRSVAVRRVTVAGTTEDFASYIGQYPDEHGAEAYWTEYREAPRPPFCQSLSLWGASHMMAVDHEGQNSQSGREEFNDAFRRTVDDRLSAALLHFSIDPNPRRPNATLFLQCDGGTAEALASFSERAV